MGQSEFKNKAHETFPRAFCYFNIPGPFLPRFFLLSYGNRPSLDFAQSLLVIDVSLGLKFVYPGSINCMRRSRGGGGTGGLDPTSGISQVIWVSIVNKQLDPPLEKARPRPSPGKCWTLSGTLEKYNFL